MKTRTYIDINNKIYLVKELDKVTKLNLAHAYHIKKYALPYMGDINKFDKLKPGLYMEGENIKAIYPLSNKARKEYSIENSYAINDAQDVEKLIKTKGGIVKPEDIEMLMSESDDVFAPPIDYSKDNILQQMIKMALELKKIDINNYLCRFDNTTDLNNEKRSLLKHGKMSFEKFMKWCNKIDLDIEIRIRDSKNAIHPMYTQIEKKISNE